MLNGIRVGNRTIFFDNVAYMEDGKATNWNNPTPEMDDDGVRLSEPALYIYFTGVDLANQDAMYIVLFGAEREAMLKWLESRFPDVEVLMKNEDPTIPF